MPPNNLIAIPRMPPSVEARVRQPFNAMAVIFESWVRSLQFTRDGEEFLIGGGGGGGDTGAAEVFFPYFLPGPVAYTTAPNRFLTGQTIWPSTVADVGLAFRQLTGQTGNAWELRDSSGTVISFLNSSGGIGLSANSFFIYDRVFSWNSTLTLNNSCSFTGRASDNSIEFSTQGLRVLPNSTIPTLDMRPFSSGGGAANVYTSLRIRPQRIGATSAGFGSLIQFMAQTSTTADIDLGAIKHRWADATHATRSGRAEFTVYYTTTEQEFMRAVAASGGVVLTLGNDSTWDGMVVNESGEDADVRFEGDTATSLLVLDAGLDAVQIGTTTAGVIADFRTGGTVFNEDGADRDFRVEGDTDVDLLFVDASTDSIGISTNAPGSTLDVAGSFQCDSINNDTGLAHGQFSPTASAPSNLDSTPTMSEVQYMRVGNVVTVSGRFNADPTAVGATSFELDLPVATDFVNADMLAGVAFCGAIAGQGAAIAASAANDTAVVSWVAVDVAAQNWSYTLTYFVQ